MVFVPQSGSTGGTQVQLYAAGKGIRIQGGTITAREDQVAVLPDEWESLKYLKTTTTEGEFVYVSAPWISKFINLEDVDITDLTTESGKVIVVNDDGTALTTSSGSIFLRTPLVQEIHTDHMFFSDGIGGTYTNGMKTNEYNHLDINYNRIKNAVIDCGAFYD